MELAKARVSVNRVAAVVANEWKDKNNRAMPVKQWLEDRKCFQVLTADNRNANFLQFFFPTFNLTICSNQITKI